MQEIEALLLGSVADQFVEQLDPEARGAIDLGIAVRRLAEQCVAGEVAGGFGDAQMNARQVLLLEFRGAFQVDGGRGEVACGLLRAAEIVERDDHRWMIGRQRFSEQVQGLGEGFLRDQGFAQG